MVKSLKSKWSEGKISLWIHLSLVSEKIIISSKTIQEAYLKRGLTGLRNLIRFWKINLQLSQYLLFSPVEKRDVLRIKGETVTRGRCY